MADEGDGPKGELVVTLPGVQDILVIPPLESVAIKRERLTRWHLNSGRSTIPEPLRWLPQLLGWFDDAQDILFTALTLSIPLLRRLPARFVPYLGWALLANDTLNLFTWALSAPLNPRPRKVEFLRTARKAAAGRLGAVRAAEAFLLPGRFKFLPFALTAGQVLYTFTGWGLRLGSLMSAISETFWAGVALVQGKNVVIAGPPPSDPAAKAARFLAQSWNWNAAAEVMRPDEISTLIAACNVSMGMSGAPGLPHLDDAKLSTIADLRIPTFKPWTSSTIAAVAEWPVSDVDDQRCATPTIAGRPGYADAIRACLADAPDLDVTLAQGHRRRWLDWPDGYLAGEAAQWTWDVFGSGFGSVVPVNSPMERMFGLALERGYIPPWHAYPEDPRVRARWIRPSPDRGPEYYASRNTAPGERRTNDPYWPIAYPAPSEDPEVQLAHWCALGLAIYCRRKLWWPAYRPARAGTAYPMEIYAWSRESPHYPDPMGRAALLCWGNNWIRYEVPTLDAPAGRAPKTCFPAPWGWASLSGQVPELPTLARIFEALGPIANRPVHERGVPTSTLPRMGRDWLDAWLMASDPRRATGPKFPAIDPPPSPEDSEPNPDDPWRYTLGPPS